MFNVYEATPNRPAELWKWRGDSSHHVSSVLYPPGSIVRSALMDTGRRCLCAVIPPWSPLHCSVTPPSAWNLSNTWSVVTHIGRRSHTAQWTSCVDRQSLKPYLGKQLKYIIYKVRRSRCKLIGCSVETQTWINPGLGCVWHLDPECCSAFITGSRWRGSN